MRVLFCGSRYWTNRDKIKVEIDKLDATDIVIHGACTGADQIAGELAKNRGMKVIEFPADWDKYGKAAGPIRNGQMLTEGQPDKVIAFTENLETSRGTKNMIEQTQKAGIPYVIIS